VDDIQNMCKVPLRLENRANVKDSESTR
jgi:hypothetical protein